MLFRKIKIRSSFQSLSRGKAFPFISRASLTLESALVFPLFFFAMVMLISLMNAVGLQVSENLRLSEKARKLAMSAYAISVQEDEKTGDGLWIDLPSAVSYSFPVSLLPSSSLKLALRARVYPWIGGDMISGAGDSDDDSRMVYLTDNGEVYHTCSDCTHLDLSVREVSLEEVKNLRNAYGKKYRPCRGFTGTGDRVYVTEKGDYYYPSQSYAGLTRHLRLVRLSEVSALPLCSRCAGRSHDSAA